MVIKCFKRQFFELRVDFGFIGAITLLTVYNGTKILRLRFCRGCKRGVQIYSDSTFIFVMFWVIEITSYEQ